MKNQKLKVYMGWDSREQIAYDVARHSILKRAANPKLVQITPLELEHLGHILKRPIEHRDGKMWCPISEAPMATEFAISRFCVPFIQNKGWALFCDCDVVFQADIAELFEFADEDYAIMVVKRVQPAGSATKMDGQVQTTYPRKNWSSIVLWNCGHPAHKNLTLQQLNGLPGRDLHAFKWLKDGEIGVLPEAWNQLVDIDPEPEQRKLLHYTLGGPWLPDWKARPSDDAWLEELKSFKAS